MLHSISDQRNDHRHVLKRDLLMCNFTIEG